MIAYDRELENSKALFLTHDNVLVGHLIAEAVTKAGGTAVLTDPDHPSGSDRIFEALNKVDPQGRAGIVINTGEDNYLTTDDAVEAAHTVTTSQLLNEYFAKEAGLEDWQLGLGHAFEIQPEREVDDIVGLPLRFVQPVELIAELARRIEHRRDRAKIDSSAVKAQQIESHRFERGHGVGQFMLGNIACGIHRARSRERARCLSHRH